MNCPWISMRPGIAACLLLMGATTPTSGLADIHAGAPAGAVSREVTFMSGPDRIFGTLELPARTPGRRLPGALLIAGSGPVDRNGNEPSARLNHMDTLRNFADTLARAGVASLRYDKLGTGRTGFATHPDPATAGFNLYADEAWAAFRFLATRREIDPHRLLIVGHSEGGLITLILSTRRSRPSPPRALALAAPPHLPILETIRTQEVRALKRQVQSGSITQAEADAALAELDRIIAQLKQRGTIPSNIHTPSWKYIFNPANTKYLNEEERYDPRTLTRHVAPALPVLLLHGKKDTQITEGDIHGLLKDFRSSRHTRVVLYDLPNVDHVFKEVQGAPNPLVDYNNPALRFSREAARRITAFVRARL